MAAKKTEKIKIDNAAKTITMYQRAFESLSAEEEAKVARYQGVGYELIIKDNPVPKGAKKDKTKEADILKALEKDEAALATYKAKKAAGGFFAAKSWYQHEYKAK